MQTAIATCLTVLCLGFDDGKGEQAPTASPSQPRAAQDGFLNFNDLQAGDTGAVPYENDAGTRYYCETKINWVIGDSTTALDIETYCRTNLPADQRVTDDQTREVPTKIIVLVKGPQFPRGQYGDEVRLTGKFKVNGISKLRFRPQVLEIEWLPANSPK